VADRFGKTGLRGLVVATFPAPSTAYALQREMFASAGLPPRIKEGAFGSLQGILEAKEANVALELEPNVSLAQTRGAKILYSMAQRVGKFTSTGVLVSARWAKGHQPQARDFCASLDEAFNLIRKDPPRVTAILAQRFPDIPAGVLQSAMGRSTREGVIPSAGRVDPAGWERSLELRAAIGDLTDIPAARSALDQGLCYAPAGAQ
jgi:NitT/TauT family transport system substrate-binding protein